MGPEGKSLLKVIDKTVCPMGSRLLYRWLILPLLDISRLNKRHDAVEAFFSNNEFQGSRRVTLFAAPVTWNVWADESPPAKISPREMIQLSEGVRGAMTLKDILRGSGIPVLEDIGVGMTDIIDVADWISATISGDAPTSFGKAPVIAPGVDPELDELRGLHANSRSKLQEIQAREMEATGISSLKVAYNNVFGYYLEVRNTHKDKVPEYWIRKQTLVNAERYITPELKEYEEKIAGAEERIAAIEDRIYKGLLSKINTRFTDLHVNAPAVAQTDCLLSFAEAAAEYGYVRPEIDDSLSLSIMEGRHPVIERNMTPGRVYVSNSVTLDSDSCQIIMITGPNMSGKSALLRQTALIALMAQIGSFVLKQRLHV